MMLETAACWLAAPLLSARRSAYWSMNEICAASLHTSAASLLASSPRRLLLTYTHAGRARATSVLASSPHRLLHMYAHPGHARAASAHARTPDSLR
jgi:hypothetical protein